MSAHLAAACRSCEPRAEGTRIRGCSARPHAARLEDVNESKLVERSAANGPRVDLWYAIVLFGAAALAIWLGIERQGGVLQTHGADVAAFFLIYGLVTVSIGYRHPYLGYYSFDRVAQVASILVLGPVDAAWINGLASLIYPWHRLLGGASRSQVLVASITNAGMMALMILIAGSLYTMLGGDVPLLTLTPTSLLWLLIMVATMQVMNHIAMLGALRATGARPEKLFNLFSIGFELSAAATAVLVALVFNTMSTPALMLLLGVLTLGMLVIRQFANMRLQLERLVEERTRDLQAKTLELEQQAMQDTLTGLHNRRYADNFLARHLDDGERRSPLVIAMADIDFFKRINDGHSHAVGDSVLRRVGEILRARCRKTDMIARYGGEEFLLCFPDTDLNDAIRLCETLRSAVEKAGWANLGLSDGVTVSFGIAVVHARPSCGDTPLREADQRLYAAKRLGRNRVVAG